MPPKKAGASAPTAKKKKAAAAARRSKTRMSVFGSASRRIYNAPIKMRRTIASKDFTLVDTKTSAGTVDQGVTNGFLLLTTTAAQNIFFFSVAQGFCLKDDPNRAELTNICEKYKLTGVKVRIIPYFNSVEAQSASNVSNADIGGFIHHIVDYDDYTSITASDAGIDQMRQYSNYKVNKLQKGLTRFIRPKMSVPVYQSGVTAAYMPTKAGYIDEQYTEVEHYGIKFMFEIVNPSAAVRYINLKWENTYYFTLKDRR